MPVFVKEKNAKSVICFHLRNSEKERIKTEASRRKDIKIAGIDEIEK